MKKVMLFAALFTLAATSAYARTPCLQLDRIYNWKAPNNRTLIVEDYRHQKFKLALLGYCQQLTFRERLAFRSRGGTELSCLTAGDDVIVHSFGIGRQTCPISKIELYTPEMQQADKDAAAAKVKASDTHY